MKLGIIGAMQIEIENLKPSIKNQTTEIVSGVTFTCGEIDGVPVVAAVSGMGKVFAAICAEVMILHFGVDHVVNIGVAGALVNDLKVFDVVVAESAVQHDMDASPIGFPEGSIPEINITYFKSDESLKKTVIEVLTERGITFKTGVIASGDLFVDKEEQRQRIRQKFNGIAADMEGGSIAQTCYVNHVPYIIIRSISDGGDNAMDYHTFSAKAAEQSINIVLGVIAKIS